MKLIILDRDGVINQDSDAFIKSENEWIPIPGSLEAIAALNEAGFTVAVATNQSGIARGLYDEQTLTAMHAKMAAMLQPLGGKVDRVVYCPHGPDDHCDCRKPLPGLFQQLASHYQQDLNTVFTVGDSWRDLQAGMAVGCLPVLVKTGKGEKTLTEHAEEIASKSIPVFDCLADAVDNILKL